MQRRLVFAIGFGFGLAACRPAAPVVAPVEPVPLPAAIVAVAPAPPEWPVPMRVLRWGAHGLEPIGTLPGLATLPDEPWLADR